METSHVVIMLILLGCMATYIPVFMCLFFTAVLGFIIILATLIPVLLLAKLENIYIILLIVTTLWMGTIGFIDYYIKKFKNDKKN